VITVKVTGDGGRTALAGISARMNHPAPVMIKIAELLDDRVEENFANSEGPLGKWPDLKRMRKTRGANPQILVDTSRLKNSITTRHGDNTAEVGTNVVYAAIHQFGGGIDMPARSQRAYFRQDRTGSVGRLFVRKAASNFAQWYSRGAHMITIPPRPFLPFAAGKLQDGVEADILHELAGFLLDKPV
jgi:phage virion morphogenesis protein